MSELPKPGELFEGRYELLDILGSGGVGTVFRALQTDINRYVAIKILHQHIAVDPEFRQRFLREAQALNKLNHPNVVSVYHMGLTPSAQAYLVMELIEGISARKLLNDNGRLPTLRALKIIKEAALALSFVHKIGIVHRDLKPCSCKNQKAEQTLEEAIREAKGVQITRPQNLASLHHYLGEIYLLQNKYDAAEEQQQQAIKLLQTHDAPGKSALALSDVYQTLGTIASKRGQHADAAKFYKESVQLKEKCRPRRAPAEINEVLEKLAGEYKSCNDANGESETVRWQKRISQKE